MVRFLLLSLSALVLLAGCEQVDKNLEMEDSRNPHFKKAEADMEAHNYPEAVKDYEAALRASPKVVSAHYELGLIYSDKLGDPISAMYHFHKYLELRPAAENRDKVEALLESEKISFAATLPNSPVQNAEAFARLQSENVQLKKELEQKLVKIAENRANLNDSNAGPVDNSSNPPSTGSTVGLRQPDAGSGASTPVVNQAPSVSKTPENKSSPDSAAQAGSATATIATSPKAAAGAVPQTSVTTPAREPKNYTIQSGDSLWKISRKFYPGDTKNGVDRIKQANATILSEGKPLKIGTIIVIP